MSCVAVIVSNPRDRDNISYSQRSAPKAKQMHSDLATNPSTSSISPSPNLSPAPTIPSSIATSASHCGSSESLSEPVTKFFTTSPHPTSFAELARKTRCILSDLDNHLEQRHAEKQQRTQRHCRVKRSRSHDLPSSPVVMRTTATRHTRRSSLPCTAVATTTDHNGQRRLSSEFASFCERLVLANTIWKQQKQLKALRKDLETEKKEKEAAAFKSFCDQLVQWNKIWKLEREAKALLEEGEKLKRRKVAAVTRAAKRMVVEIQKERLVEEFVKDLIEEAAASRRDTEDLRVQHEKEVKEIHGEWLRDFRRVTRELEALKLARQARLVEQELGNSHEDALYETLYAQKQRIEALEAEIAEYEKSTKDFASLQAVVREEEAEVSHPYAFPDDEPTDVEIDILSELSTSSTCVSSLGGSAPRLAKSLRRSLSVMAPPTCQRYISRHGDPSKQSLLFSMNDITADTVGRQPAMDSISARLYASTRACCYSAGPLAIRNRTLSAVSSKHASPMLSYGMENKASGSTIRERPPWRF